LKHFGRDYDIFNSKVTPDGIEDLPAAKDPRTRRHKPARTRFAQDKGEASVKITDTACGISSSC
jgi:hypothetical protein